PENATNTPIPPSPTPVPPTNTAFPPTATTGAAAVATPGGGISIPTGKAVSAADQQLIMDAITATHNLKSYHAVVEASGDMITESVKLEGDFVAPDKAYFK